MNGQGFAIDSHTSELLEFSDVEKADPDLGTLFG